MRLYRETALRKQADEPTIRMLNLWQSLSEQIFDIPIEVMVGNRHECQQLSSFDGELYTASPVVVEKKIVLALWLDSLSNVNSIHVTHEIGHWILKLQGFRGMLYQPEKHCDIEILLNSMVHHPPLYVLQRSFGHEPQEEIDSRTDNNIKIFAREKETNEKQLWIKNAILLADDFINCSEEKRKQLKEIINNKHPNVAKFLETILEITTPYNLLDAKKNLKCFHKITQNLKLGNEWYEVDEVKELRKMIKQISDNNPIFNRD